MPVITVNTEIEAPIERCFDLSRSIEIHKISMEHTNEEAIAGRTSGLIEDGETVTWQANHFGVTQFLSSKISNFNRPYIFRDTQTKGIFNRFIHDHKFESKNENTILTDELDYEAPLGFLGRIADFLFLKKYMTNLILKRNKVIKEFAESEQWKTILA
ncbi:MAG: SRPBCC family protein [Chitinophagales bacterium]